MPLLRGTPRQLRAPTGLALLLAVWIGVAACGAGPGTGTSHSPTPVAAASPTHASASATAPPPGGSTPTPSSTPPPVSGPYGVLAGPFAGASYTITLVKIDGKVAAATQASTPPSPTCAGQAAGVVPYPVATSDAFAYFMDAKGAVRTLSGDGSVSASPVITLPVGPSTRSVFAVSSDDSRMAVAIIDFVSGGATTRLFVDQILAGGGAQHLIFSESGSYTLWPVGWHGGDLVVAKVPSCTQGGGPTCCGPQELHVVDAATAVRKYTLGGPGCIVVGAPTPGGTMCEDTSFTKASVLNWAGNVVRSYPISGPEGAYLSPSGDRVALVDNTGTSVPGSNVSWPRLLACGWIDDIHVLSGGDQQQQPTVGEFPSGVSLPVAAQGDCAGRIPGGL